MRRELTWQAVLSAFLVAVLVSASYPYVVLKLGMGPNISVVSAFLGAILLLGLARRTHGKNRLMNNIVQTAGTSAASTAFMCIIAASVDFAARNPVAHDHLDGIEAIRPWPMFWWLTCAGGIGVLFTVLFRRHFLSDPKMVFADGVAAAETIVVLDTAGGEARDKMTIMGVCGLASALVDWFREGLEKLPDLFPSSLFRSYQTGIEWNLLSLGSGLLINLNVSLSMLAASLVLVLTGPILIDQGAGREIVLNNIAPAQREVCRQFIDRDWSELTEEEQALVKQHGGKLQVAYMEQDYFRVLLLWFMWPATALMITSAITAVLLHWRAVVDSLKLLWNPPAREKGVDMSLSTVVLGSVLLTLALAVVQKMNFGMSYLQTAVAILCSLPLILVGIRVLGETNNGPISVMMNGLQAIFAAFWPVNVGHNLIAAGMAGTCNSQGQGTIQDYKTGQLVGSTPRVLTWVQLGAIPVGAAAVAVMYPLLLNRYELGVSLPAPTAIKISNMAVLLSQGVDAFPRGALSWTVIAAVAGVLLSVVQHFRHLEWLPSAAGFGFGLILPGTLNIPMAIGGILGWIWSKSYPSSYERYLPTVASGLIAGEALLGGLLLPVLLWLKLH